MNKLRELSARMRRDAPDALMVGGAAAISYGAWLASPALGWVVGGIFAVIAGLLWAGSGK